MYLVDLRKKLSKSVERLDRRFRKPRIWSNRELEKFSPLFEGKVINVSAWRDEDKEGSFYERYFSSAESYVKSNYNGARGLTDGDPESIEVDLVQPIDPKLISRFDVVFNHTTLEHVFDFRTAFGNLCRLSKDIVILVVPFIQEQHGGYGDYWRFTPTGIKKLFAEEGFTTVYLSFNDVRKQSIYVFAIGSRRPENWMSIWDPSRVDSATLDGVGGKFLCDSLPIQVLKFFRKKF